MAKRIIPNEFKTHLIDQLVESITEKANTIYYTFVGDHISTGVTEQEITQPDPSNRTLNIDTYRNMVFGKKITQDDMRIVIKRNDWAANTVFARYDDEDINLFNKNFFMVTDEGAFKHIYKCLNNANNAPSTIQPVFNDITFDDDNYYETADGYQWKYMYSIDEVNFAKFATQKYIPVIANTEVENSARNGSIDVVKIQTEERLGSEISLNGKFYNNYLTDLTLTSADISVGNTVQYRVPAGASTVRGFYGNTVIHIVSGEGAGQYRSVIDSYLSLSLGGVILQLQNAFLIPPNETSRFEVSPEIKIVGDGRETIKADARAVINANASNSVHRVEMLNTGLDYNYATAEVLKGVPASAQGTSVGDLVIPTDAVLVPIIPPPGGHGANTVTELGGSALCIYTKYEREEDGTIPTENSFAQFGIIRDPLFANVEIDFIKKSDGFDGSDGEFVEGENIYQFTKIPLSGNVSVEASNNFVVSISNNETYDGFLKVDDYVYVTSDENVQYNFLAQITQLVNANAFTVNLDCPWSSTNAQLNLARVNAIAKVKNIQTSSKIFLKDVYGKLITDQLIIGDQTFAIANVSHIDINSKYPSPSNYNFDVFTQYTKCIGTISGSFSEDEIVYQGVDSVNSDFKAYVHSANSTHLFITQSEGILNTAAALVGASSGAILNSPFNKYDGDLDPTSGIVIYLQNEIPITRNENRSEEIRVILEF
jgi:hypothetical protein